MLTVYSITLTLIMFVKIFVFFLLWIFIWKFYFLRVMLQRQVLEGTDHSYATTFTTPLLYKKFCLRMNFMLTSITQSCSLKCFLSSHLLLCGIMFQFLWFLPNLVSFTLKLLFMLLAKYVLGKDCMVFYIWHIFLHFLK